MDAQITTDGWRSYKSLKSKGWQITQKNSNGGKNFDAMHWLIMTMKATIRVIYGSVRDLQLILMNLSSNSIDIKWKEISSMSSF